MWRDYESTDLESAARLAREEDPQDPPERPSDDELYADELERRRDLRPARQAPEDVY